jgi:hypothetical protein
VLGIDSGLFECIGHRIREGLHPFEKVLFHDLWMGVGMPSPFEVVHDEDVVTHPREFSPVVLEIRSAASGAMHNDHRGGQRSGREFRRKMVDRDLLVPAAKRAHPRLDALLRRLHVDHGDLRA